MHVLKGNPKRGLLGATIGFFFGFASVALFGSTASMFKEILQINPFWVGFLVAAPSLSGSLLRIPFAAWVDTTGGRKPFLILLILSIVGMLGLLLVIHSLSFEHTARNLYPLLIFLGILSGCGIATFSVGISQVSYWFPQKNQGMALGLYAGVGNLAPGIFSFLLPISLGFFGLSGSYLIWLILLMVGTILYARLGLNAWYFQLCQRGWAKEEAKQIARKQYGQEIFPSADRLPLGGSLVQSLIISGKRWKTWILVAIYFTTFGGFIALTAWFPTYWRSFFQLGVIKAGALTAFFSILASLSRIIGGKLSDKYQGEITAMAALSIVFLGSFFMAQSHNVWMALCASMLIAVGMGVTNAAVFKLVPQELPEAVGGASGWVGGLGAFGGFVIPLLLGAIVFKEGAQGYAYGFYIFVILSLISLFLTFVMKRRQTINLSDLEPPMIWTKKDERISRRRTH